MRASSSSRLAAATSPETIEATSSGVTSEGSGVPVPGAQQGCGQSRTTIDRPARAGCRAAAHHARPGPRAARGPGAGAGGPPRDGRSRPGRARPGRARPRHARPRHARPGPRRPPRAARRTAGRCTRCAPGRGRTPHLAGRREVGPGGQADLTAAVAAEADQHRRLHRPEADEVRQPRRDLPRIGDGNGGGAGAGAGERVGRNVHAATLAAGHAPRPAVSASVDGAAPVDGGRPSRRSDLVLQRAARRQPRAHVLGDDRGCTGSCA